jgi:deazaflavin-dependent oxidoreductase (nitroreductase family)
MATWNPAARLLFATHALLYRVSSGRIGGNLNGPVLLLTTVGRKTGQRRTRPLGYLRDGARMVVVGSNGGKDVHPAWVWNLRSAPEAEVQVNARTFRVRAEEASPAEEARLWPLLVAQSPVWGTYRSKTARPLPLVILRPIADGGLAGG